MIDWTAFIAPGSLGLSLVSLVVFGVRAIINGSLVPRRQHEEQIAYMNTELTAARTAYENERVARTAIQNEFVAWVRLNGGGQGPQPPQGGPTP